MSRLVDWWDQRTGMRGMVHAMLYEHIPGGARWRYVWGSTLVFTFAVQMITGFFLWMAYSPSSQTAWESVWYIQNEMAGGAIVRGIHHYTAQVMIVLIALHMLQVIVDGAYRAPREVNFWIGLILLHIVLGLSLTGYLLPWDQKGYWATKVATSILASIPLVGSSLQRLVVGGPEYGHHTLTRFFALHAGLLPFLMIVFTAAHVYVFRRHGLRHKEPKKRADAYFWSDQVFRDAVACLGVLAVVLLLVFRWQLVRGGATHVGAELHAPADPSEPFGAARPEWYFLFLFQFLKLEAFAGEAEWIGAVVIPGAVIAVLFLMPLIGKWKWGHRFNIAFTILLFSFALLLTAMAIFEDAGAPGLRLPFAARYGGWVGLILLVLLTLGALLLFPLAISVERRGYRFGLGLAVAMLVGVALLAAYILSGEANRVGGADVSLAGVRVLVPVQKALLFGLLTLIALVLTAAMVREHAPNSDAVYSRGHELRHRLRLGVLGALLAGAVLLVALNFAPARAKEDFSHAVEQAERDAARVSQLAGARGIPVEGAVSLLRSDPLTQGPKLFARNCASCHRYDGHDGTGLVPVAHTGLARAGGSAGTIVLAEDAATQEDAYTAARVRIDAGAGAGQERMIVSYAAASRTATVNQPWHAMPDATSRYTVFAPQSAPDLAGFATRDWLAGMMDPAKVDSVKYFGPAMEAHQGKMVDFVKEEVAVADATEKAELDKIITALAADANLKGGPKEKPDEAVVREGRALVSGETFDCTRCHDYRGEKASRPRSRGPDLTGYGTEEWVAGIIANPEHPRFYGDKNDRMPLYGEKDILDDRSILLLARWLRGDEAPVDATPAPVLATDKAPAATQPAAQPAADEAASGPEAELPVVALAAPAAAKPPATAPGAGKVDFAKQIKPLFEAHCVKCHGPKKTSSGYRLHTKELAFKGGDKAEEAGEPAIIPGDAKGSLLFQLISLKEDHDDHMPPKGKAPQLKKDQMELIRRWIDGGASWPDKVELTPPPEEKGQG